MKINRRKLLNKALALSSGLQLLVMIFPFNALSQSGFTVSVANQSHSFTPGNFHNHHSWELAGNSQRGQTSVGNNQGNGTHRNSTNAPGQQSSSTSVSSANSTVYAGNTQLMPGAWAGSSYKHYHVHDLNALMQTKITGVQNLSLGNSSNNLSSNHASDFASIHDLGTTVNNIIQPQHGEWKNTLASSFLGPGLKNGNSGSSVTNTNFSVNQNWVAGHSVRVWSNMSVGSRSYGPSINLDLTSTGRSMTAGQLLHGGTVTINVGGTLLTVNSHTRLTPAEYLAVRQVVAGEQQSLIINNQGAADGGSVVIGSHLSQELSSLVIPQGVTVIDLARSGTLNLNGNLIDDGNLYIASLSPTKDTLTLNANNISVQQQGLISDVLPAGTLSWLNNTSANLILNAVNNITNAGTISSGGSLSLTAGGSITNALPTGVTGQVPLMQAVNNVNLAAGSGNITNTGLIASTTGNINIASSATQDITINASGGQFSALNGAINVRDASYTGSNNITMTGGNYSSEELNLNDGTGAINGSTGEVTGQFNTVAGDVHMSASTPTLVLGNNLVSGDPTYVNTSGNIQLTGAITATESLAIIASGNIYIPSGAVVSLSTSGSSGSNIVLIAGAKVTCSGCSNTTSLSGSLANGSGSITYNISGASSTGGYIDLSTNNQIAVGTVINTSATGTNGSGGNVTLAAYANGIHTGYVLLSTYSTINTAGNGTGANGSVSIYAGGTNSSSNGIVTGSITTNGTSDTGTAGNITLVTAQPVASNLSFNSSGVQSGTLSYSSNTTTGANIISTGNLATYSTSTGNGGNITLIAGGAIAAAGTYGYFDTHTTGSGATGGNITLGSGTASFTVGSLSTYSTNGTPGNLTFQQSGSVLTNPTVSLSSSGLNINVSGSTSSTTPSINLTLGNGDSISIINTKNSGSGNSGSVTLNSSLPGGITITGFITSGNGAISLIASGTNAPISVAGNLFGASLTLTAAGSIAMGAGVSVTGIASLTSLQTTSGTAISITNGLGASTVNLTVNGYDNGTSYAIKESTSGYISAGTVNVTSNSTTSGQTVTVGMDATSGTANQIGTLTEIASSGPTNNILLNNGTTALSLGTFSNINNLTIAGAGGSGNGAGAITTAAGFSGANFSGAVVLNSSSTINISQAMTANGVTLNGLTETINQTLTSTGTVNITSTNTVSGNDVVIGGEINAPGQSVNITINGYNNGLAFAVAATSTGFVTANAVNVTSNNTTSGQTVSVSLNGQPNAIGALSETAATGSTNNITVNNGTTSLALGIFSNIGSLTIPSAGAITISASSTFGGTLTLTSSGSINLSQAITADAVTLDGTTVTIGNTLISTGMVLITSTNVSSGTGLAINASLNASGETVNITVNGYDNGTAYAINEGSSGIITASSLVINSNYATSGQTVTVSLNGGTANLIGALTETATAGPINNITLNNGITPLALRAFIDINNLTVTSAGAITTAAGSTFNGVLSLTSSGNIYFSEAMAANGVTLNGLTETLNQTLTSTSTVNITSTNTASGNDIVIGGEINAPGQSVNITINGYNNGAAFAIAATSAGSITANTVTITSNNNIPGSIISISLNGQPNAIGTLSEIAATGPTNNITVDNGTTSLALGIFSNIGSLTVPSAGAITISASSTFGGTLTLTSSGSINLSQAITADAVTLSGATVTIGNTLISTGGAVNITSDGEVIFNPGSTTTAYASIIVLASNGIVIGTAGGAPVTLTANDPSGNMTLTSSAGNITAGNNVAFSSYNSVTFTPNASGGTVTLDGTQVNIAGMAQQYTSSATVNTDTITIRVAPPPPVVTSIASSSSSSGTASSNSSSTTSNQGISNINVGVQTDRVSTQVSLSQQINQSSSSVVLQSSGDDEQVWFIAEGPRKPFTLADDRNTIILGEEGTVLAIGDPRTILIQSGRMVVITDEIDVNVQTERETINVGPHTAVLINANDPQTTKVTNIIGAIKLGLDSSGQSKEFSIAQGQEYTVATSEVASSGNAPGSKFGNTLGSSAPESALETTPETKSGNKSASAPANITGSTSKDMVILGNFGITNQKIDARRIVETDPLFGCGGADTCLSKKIVSDIKQSLDQGKTQGIQYNKISFVRPLNKSTDLAYQLQPMGFSTPTAPSTLSVPKLITLNIGQGTIVKHNRSAEIKIQDQKIVLKKGEAIITTREPVTVDIGYGNVFIAPGDMVLLNKDTRHCKIHTLWEAKAKSVKLVTGSHSLNVSAGQECIIAQDEKTITAIQKVDSIGRRQIRQITLSNGQHVSTAEVSLLSIMLGSSVLHTISSSLNEDEVAMANKVLKMAACLHIVTASHGEYITLGAPVTR